MRLVFPPPRSPVTCSECGEAGHNRQRHGGGLVQRRAPEALEVLQASPRALGRHARITFETYAEILAHPICPRPGCGGLLLKRVDPIVLCQTCGRDYTVREFLLTAR